MGLSAPLFRSLKFPHSLLHGSQISFKTQQNYCSSFDSKASNDTTSLQTASELDTNLILCTMHMQLSDNARITLLH